MNRTFTVLLVLVFLTASCVFAQPVLSSDESSESPWKQMPPMPVAGYGFKAGVVNDAVFLIKSNYTFEYNLYSWSTKHSMPTPRSDFATATYKNKIYCIGGKTDSTPSATNQVYDPASDSWESKAAMPTPRHGLDANVVNGRIYLISGLVQHSRFPDVEGTFEPTNVTEVYDPNADTWSTKTPIPNPAHYYASAVVNNRIYIISEKFTQIYDTETDTWSYGTSPPFSVDMAGGATVTSLAPQLIYVIGGRDSLEVAYNQVYNVENDSWSKGTPMPTARYGLAVAAVNEKIYAIGGVTGSFVAVVQKDSNEQYDPLKDKTTPVTTSNSSSSPPPSQHPTINTGAEPPQTEPFLTTLAVAAIIVVAVVGAGLLVYFKKHKRKKV